MKKNIIQIQKNSMKQILALISLILIVISLNFFPYEYSCFRYPLAGCSDSDFWWNLPSKWESYNGINWLGYIFQNFIVILIVVKVFNKLTEKE